MVHPQDWGKGSMGEISIADLVIRYDDEKVLDPAPEILKDRGHQFSEERIRVIFIDPSGERHVFVGNRVRDPARKW